MAKPFRLSQEDRPTRDETGRFANQMVPPAPPQIVDGARSAGRSVDKEVADKRVPDHPVEKTTKQPGGGYQEEKPWPPADSGNKPMRVG
jgi:hypothetical protein